MSLADYLEPVFQAFGVIGLVVLVAAALSTRNPTSLLTWGAVGAGFLLLHVFWLRAHFAGFNPSAPNSPLRPVRRDAVISAISVAAYFGLALFRSVRGGARRLTSSPPRSGYPAASAPGIAQTKVPAGASPRPVPVVVRVGLLLGVLMTCLLFAGQTQVALAALLVFPAGLANVLNTGSRVPDLALLIAAYVAYPVLFVALLATRKWPRFWALSLVLICLVLLNIAGCRKMVSDTGSALQ